MQSASSSAALSHWPLTLTQRLPAENSKAKSFGVRSVSQTMKLGEKSCFIQFVSSPAP